ncbi:MAG: hypothetical protein CUN56_12310 [Phototrophicales bacterium]|nr:MAG: hypothetical protein CUN56_12310 [Phototrophicales bacterium]RMG76509.1 MAG: hypothetical protein D6711_03775 [Chloroflexota bacterium]
MDQNKWDALRDEMRDFLINLARLGKTISYSELAAQLQTAYIHHRAPMFSELLRQISYEDKAANRPMLATLVVNKQRGIPGDGYFKGLVEEDFIDPETYWQARFEEVCQYWQEH